MVRHLGTAAGLALLVALPVRAQRTFGSIAVSPALVDSAVTVMFDPPVHVDWDRAVPETLTPRDSGDVAFIANDSYGLSSRYYYLVGTAGVSRLRFEQLVGTVTFSAREALRPVSGQAVAKVLEARDSVPAGFVLSAQASLVISSSPDTLNTHEIAAALERARTDSSLHHDIAPGLSWIVIRQYAFVVGMHHWVVARLQPDFCDLRYLLLDAGPPVRVLAVDETSCDV